jgi:2-dehydro-3-deoxyphosphogalactonate aldolase
MTLEDALAHCPLVAILRGVLPDEVEDIAAALFDAGVRAVEVPLNSPDPLESVALLSRGFGDAMAVGAGTVLRPAEVDAVHAAGARLVVSPNTDAAVIGRADARGMTAVPGFATATEALAAIAAGADMLKLFPASTYGPAHLKALNAVLPRDVGVLAVGGVGGADFPAWRAAGAAGFGIGGELYRPGQSAAETLEKAMALVREL